MPLGVRKALTRIVESRTARGTLFSESLNLSGNLFLQLSGAKLTGWLLGVDRLHDFEYAIPCFPALNNRNRLEQNTFFDRLCLEVVAFCQVEALPEIRRQGHLGKALDLDQCHFVSPPL